MQYSEPTIYGINLIIKDYAHFPRFLPLPCHLEHGWTPVTKPLNSDLKIDKKIMLVFSKRRLRAWRVASKRPAYIMGAPFVHYRKLKKIKKNPKAKGTIVFPGHSTNDVKSSFNIKEFCNHLNSLPKKFHPVTICLFWPDFIDKKAQIYRKLGFRVISVGSDYKKGLHFVKKFYKILSKHRFATSNEVGSYAFYAVELGVPFFLTGDASLKINDENLNIDMNESKKIDQNYYGRRATKVFSTGPITKITQEQLKFVSKEMGIGDCLKSTELNKLLWTTYKNDPHHVIGTISYWVISFLLATNLLKFAFKIIGSAGRRR